MSSWDPVEAEEELSGDQVNFPTGQNLSAHQSHTRQIEQTHLQLMPGVEDEKFLEVDNECGKKEKQEPGVGKGAQERKYRVGVGWKRLRGKWR